MSKESKKVKRVIGLSLIVIAGITGIYQWRYAKVQTDSQIYVAVATKEINIGDTLIEHENFQMEARPKQNTTTENFNKIENVSGSVARDRIYKNENISINRVVSEEEYKKLDLKLISIKCTDGGKDQLVGYDVVPNDKVDLLYFDSKGTYEGKLFLEKQTVHDIKSVEGVSYKDRANGYKAAYALVWVKPDVAEEINRRQETGGYFKFQLDRDRGTKETTKVEVAKTWQ